MNPGTAEDAASPRRRTYATLALAWAAFLIYGSLVPFQFEPIDLQEASLRFSEALAWPPLVDSRIDFVVNILIALPLGYLGMAALCTDRPMRARVVGMLVVWPVCVAISVVLEFLQVFFPVRTDSLSDIIAQGCGAFAGLFVWQMVGEHATGWLRESMALRERPAMAQRLLQAYTLLFALAQLMPFDLTLNPGELSQKYKAGRIVVRPLSYAYESRSERAWDLFGTAAVAAPIGAATLLVGTGRRRRRALPAAVLAVGGLGAIELAQIFVNSRIADVTDVIAGVVGAIGGLIIALKASHRQPQPATFGQVTRLTVVGWAATLAWIATLCIYHWQPFDFTTDPARITEGVYQLTAAPFHSYYLGNEYHALTEILRKFLLAVPLGALLRAVWGKHTNRGAMIRRAVSVGFGCAVLLGIEVGQVFLQTRVPDITDVIMGAAGITISYWIANRFFEAGTVRVDVLEPSGRRG